MSRPGIYLVRTNEWYVERAGWLVAGVTGLSATLLSAFAFAPAILILTCAGLTSIINGVTGYCPVGDTLSRLGLPGGLGSRVPGGQVYRLHTDHWYLERRIYLIVGVNLMVSSLLVVLHSPWWLLFTGFVSTASIVFAFSGFCIMANFLYRGGATPRLGPIPAALPVHRAT